MRRALTPEQRFTLLFGAHSDHVRRYAMSLVVGEDAHDVFQRTFTTAWQHLDDLPSGVESQRKWLFGVVRNHYKNLQRSSRRSDALVAAIEHARPRSLIESHEQELDPIVVAALVRALGELNDEDCELMVLTGWLEMTPTEISVELEQNLNTTRSHLFRIRKRLFARYSELNEDGEIA